MTTTELEALVALTAHPHLGPSKIRQLLTHFGSALDATNASKEEVTEQLGFQSRITQNWGEWRLDNPCLKGEYQGIRLIPYTSEEYPKPLLAIQDFPLLIYVKGDIYPTDTQYVGIIGTRQATIYGCEMAKQFAEKIARANTTVISGLARGIDTAAHIGALKSGRTLAVIGSGLAHIYPKENSALAEAITQNGALLSEYPPHTPPDRSHFPRRNRIVSGLSRAMLLIEAPLKSGAMITMNFAKEQKKRCYALPGRVDHPNFEGNHHLIKTHQAQLVDTASDILQDLKITEPPHNQHTRTISLSSEEKNMIEVLPNEEVSIEQIGHITNLPVAKLNILLMSLVLKHVIKEYPGKVFRKNT